MHPPPPPPDFDLDSPGTGILRTDAGDTLPPGPRQEVRLPKNPIDEFQAEQSPPNNVLARENSLATPGQDAVVGVVSPIDSYEHLVAQQRALDAEALYHQASLELLTTNERIARGLIVPDVLVRSRAPSPGLHVALQLVRPPDQPRTNIREGSVVELVDREGTLRVQGDLAFCTPDVLEVVFNDAPPERLDEQPLTLHVLHLDPIARRAHAAMESILHPSSSEGQRIQDILLSRRAPQLGRIPSIAPPCSLNVEQLEAFERMLGSEYFLTHGPPGTGKSRVLAAAAMAARARGERVLITAASNTSVDHIAEVLTLLGETPVRIGRSHRVGENVRPFSTDALLEAEPEYRLAREQQREALEKIDRGTGDRSQALTQLADGRDLERRVVKRMVQNAPLVCATLAALGGEPLADQRFDVALLDEGNRAHEPLSVLAWLRASKVWSAADPFQTGPGVVSSEALTLGLDRSLFERLQQQWGQDGQVLLREQYRMNAGVMAFPSEQTYGGQLRAPEWVANRTLSDVMPSLPPSMRVPSFLFVDTSQLRATETVDGRSSFRNQEEATFVARYVRRLLRLGLLPEQVGVATPYSSQVSEIRRQLRQPQVEVDTAEGFANRQKEVMVVGFTRSNTLGKLGFLKDVRRTNVMLTRARVHVCTVGDEESLKIHPYYAALVDKARGVGGYRTAQPGKEPEELWA